MLTIFQSLFPIALKIVGAWLDKKQADAETQAAFIAVAKWAQSQNLVSKTLHDSFEAQADRNKAEIEKIKAKRAADAAQKGTPKP